MDTRETITFPHPFDIKDRAEMKALSDAQLKALAEYAYGQHMFIEADERAYTKGLGNDSMKYQSVWLMAETELKSRAEPPPPAGASRPRSRKSAPTL